MMYGWNWSSFIEFKNCDNNTSLKKGIKKIFKILNHISRFFKNVGKVFVMEAQTNFRGRKTS
jgi:hypothetical protein